MLFDHCRAHRRLRANTSGKIKGSSCCYHPRRYRLQLFRTATVGCSCTPWNLNRNRFWEKCFRWHNPSLSLLWQQMRIFALLLTVLPSVTSFAIEQDGALRLRTVIGSTAQSRRWLPESQPHQNYSPAPLPPLSAITWINSRLMEADSWSASLQKIQLGSVAATETKSGVDARRLPAKDVVAQQARISALSSTALPSVYSTEQDGALKLMAVTGCDWPFTLTTSWSAAPTNQSSTVWPPLNPSQT